MNAPQGSEAWLLSRCGRATASEFSAVLARGQGKTRAAYMRRVVAERLTGKPTETYSNAHMLRGQEQEPYARLAYEAHAETIVEEVGFIQHPKLMTGCSPDGFLGDDGGVEIKSVIPTVHLETILSGSYPSEHKPQIMGNLWITGRKYWEFVSYSPDFPKHLQLYIFRVERDEKYIENLSIEVSRFLAECDALHAQLMKGAS